MSIQDRSRVSSIELKLLAIPIVYVLLRIWSEILTNVAVHTENKSCSLVMFLLVMGVMLYTFLYIFTAVSIL